MFPTIFLLALICVGCGYLAYVVTRNVDREAKRLNNFPGYVGVRLSIFGAALGPLSFLMPYLIIVLILGIVLLLWGWKGKGKQSHKMGALIMGVIFLSIGFIGFIPTGPETPTCDPGFSWDGQKCVEIKGAAPWTASVPATVQGGGRDAAAEIFNDGTGTQFSLDCTADTPDGTLDADATNMFVDRSQKVITIQFTVDDDAATSAAAFSAPDCHSNDFFVKPDYPIDSNLDGTADNQLLYMRLSQITTTTLSENSTSNIPVQLFYYTLTEGFYIAFMQEDADQTGSGTNVRACDSTVGKTTLSLSDCNWVFVGDTTSTGFYVAFQWLLWSAHPFWGYENGAIGDHHYMTLEFGHPSGTGIVSDMSWKYDLTLIART